MAKDTKLIRGQLRQIVKEVLPEVLTQELAAAVHLQLQTMLRAQLNSIQVQVQESLKALDDRSREVQSFVIRQTASNTFVSDKQ